MPLYRRLPKRGFKVFKNNLTAIILCGGRGERLKPITNKTPNPLLKVAGKEILGYILRHLKKSFYIYLYELT